MLDITVVQPSTKEMTLAIDIPENMYRNTVLRRMLSSFLNFFFLIRKKMSVTNTIVIKESPTLSAFVPGRFMPQTNIPSASPNARKCILSNIFIKSSFLFFKSTIYYKYILTYFVNIVKIITGSEIKQKEILASFK